MCVEESGVSSKCSRECMDLLVYVVGRYVVASLSSSARRCLPATLMTNCSDPSLLSTALQLIR